MQAETYSLFLFPVYSSPQGVSVEVKGVTTIVFSGIETQYSLYTRLTTKP